MSFAYSSPPPATQRRLPGGVKRRLRRKADIAQLFHPERETEKDEKLIRLLGSFRRLLCVALGPSGRLQDLEKYICFFIAPSKMMKQFQLVRMAISLTFFPRKAMFKTITLSLPCLSLGHSKPAKTAEATPCSVTLNPCLKVVADQLQGAK